MIELETEEQDFLNFISDWDDEENKERFLFVSKKEYQNMNKRQSAFFEDYFIDRMDRSYIIKRLSRKGLIKRAESTDWVLTSHGKQLAE